MPTNEALDRFFNEKEKINEVFQEGRISNEAYNLRLERLRTRIKEEPVPIEVIIQSVETEAQTALASFIQATQARDHQEVLLRLKRGIEDSLKQYVELLDDIEKLLRYRYPHIILEIDPPHPCFNCICHSEAEPLNRHRNCETCQTLEDREAWEADKHPYYDGAEAGK